MTAHASILSINVYPFLGTFNVNITETPIKDLMVYNMDSHIAEVEKLQSGVYTHLTLQCKGKYGHVLYCFL